MAPSLRRWGLNLAQGGVRIFAWLLLYAPLLAGSAVAGTGISLTLAWNPVPDPQVVGYKLHYGTASRSYTRVVSCGNQTRATVVGLAHSETYYFAVTSVSASGLESAYSDEVAFTVPAAPPSMAPVKYAGLFYESDQVRNSHAGAFALTVNLSGKYSGYLQTGGLRLAVDGQLNPRGQTTNWIFSPDGSRFLLRFERSGTAPTDQILGSVTGIGWNADLSADRAVFSAANPSPFQGAYTLVVPAPAPPDPTLPAGNSYGLVTVDSSGHVRVSASLADGTRVTLSSIVSQEGRWPVYASLYTGLGSWLGWLNFTNRPTDDFNGSLSWIKPANAQSRLYPSGFTSQWGAFGSAYSRALGFSSQGPDPMPATLSFTGGNLLEPFADALSVSASGQVDNLGSTGLKLTFSPTTGAFQGMVTDPATGDSLPFAGVLFQKTQTGYGSLISGDQSSQVLLSP